MKKVLREILNTSLYLLGVLCLVYLVIHFVGQRTQVQGSSMEPKLSNEDNLIVDKLTYHFKEPKRFDIIVFPYQHEENTYYIKRIIGLPGETVSIINGKVYINHSSEPLDDSFTPETPLGDFGPYTVPGNSYFVLGDNRNDSFDSRYWKNTFVKESQILGKAKFCYFPFNRLGKIE